MSKMNEGSIKFYNVNKGYGFIIDTVSKEEYFFHASGLLSDNPMKDELVGFNLEETERGWKAINVTKI